MIGKLQHIPYYRRLLKGVQGVVRNSAQAKEFLLWYADHGSWIPRFQNMYWGEDCFLLANGPSLNSVDFERINNYHLIGLNKIYLLFERARLDLTFHVAINSLVIEQSWRQFAGLGCPSFLSYRPAAPLVEDKGNIHYVLTTQQAEPKFGRVYDEAAWEGWTVTFVALQLAYFMGFRRVFLVGLDHSFKAQGRANEEQAMAGADPNHFDPRYFADCRWHLPDLEGSEFAYALARFAFERSGRGVYDATENGHCRVFERVSLDAAFAMANQRVLQPV